MRSCMLCQEQGALRRLRRVGALPATDGALCTPRCTRWFRASAHMLTTHPHTHHPLTHPNVSPAGALHSDLSALSVSSTLPAPLLPPITMVFAAVEGGKTFARRQRKDALLVRAGGGACGGIWRPQAGRARVL